MGDPTDLSNLRDIVLPPEVPLWPLAPGWWIVAGGVVAAAAILTAAAVARHRRNAYRREALVALKHAQAQDISAILKRVALAAWPRDQVASLSGEAWLVFLDRTGGVTTFAAGPGRSLESLTFGAPADQPTVEAVAQGARRWVRRHKVAREGRKAPRQVGGRSNAELR